MNEDLMLGQEMEIVQTNQGENLQSYQRSHSNEGYQRSNNGMILHLDSQVGESRS